MRLRIGKSFMESPHGLPAQRLFRPQYVEGVHIRRVHIYLCRDAAGAEPFDIADSLRIKRFPLAYKISSRPVARQSSPNLPVARDQVLIGRHLC